MVLKTVTIINSSALNGFAGIYFLAGNSIIVI